MKAMRLPSPATLLALLALFVALGGSAFAVGRDSVKSSDIAPNAVRTSDLGPLKLRKGTMRDFDTTAEDGVFNMAYGRARCRRGERLISGGIRLRTNFSFGPQLVAMVSSGPVPSMRQWAVTLNSDVGGAARRYFSVFAYCLAR